MIGPPSVVDNCWFEYGSTAFATWSCRVHRVVAKEPGKRRRQAVGARLGDRVDLDPHRPPLRRVEAVRHELDLGDRILAEAGLSEPAARAGERLRHLLAVHVQLEGAFSRRDAVAALLGVVPRAGRDREQVLPVPPVDRQLCHLPGSMLALIEEDVVSISGASPVTVTVSWTVDGTTGAHGHRLTDEQFQPKAGDVEKPDSSAVIS